MASEEIPALRCFVVSRLNPVDCTKVLTERIMAHSMQFNRTGALLAVMYLPVDGGQALLSQYAKVYNEWLEYEEVPVHKTALTIS